MDWKAEHAVQSEKALAHPLVVEVVDELMGNLRTDSPLVRYGVEKVALYAAQVARAQCLGFDPEALRLTPDEANSEVLRVAAEAVLHGVPTVTVTAVPPT